MAVSGESIGSISIEITGDPSPLYASIQQAQAQARAAGNAIASNLTSAMAPAVQGATGLVNQYGQSIQAIAAPTQQSGAATVDFSAAISTLITAMREENSQLSLSIQRNMALTASEDQVTRSTRQRTAAAHEGVTEIQATSGALRTLESNGGIRAAERFLTMIPGLGAALQVAFPLIGAIALGEALYRMVGRFGELSEAQKKAAEATRQNDQEWERLAQHLERINVERIVAEFGKLQGLKLQGIYDESTAKRDQAELDSTLSKIELAKRTLAETQALYDQGSGLGFKRLAQDFNPLIIGQRLGEYFSAGSEKDQLAGVRQLQDAFDTLKEKQRVFEDERKKNAEDQKRTASEDAGRIGSARASNDIAAIRARSDEERRDAESQVAISKIKADAQARAIEYPYDRAIALAKDEVVAAQAKAKKLTDIANKQAEDEIAAIRRKGAAESAGKTPAEQSVISIQTRGEIQRVQSDTQSKIAQYSSEVTQAQTKLDVSGVDEAAKLWKEVADNVKKAFYEIGRFDQSAGSFTELPDYWKRGQEAVERYIDEQQAAQTRISEIEGRAAAQTDELKGERRKLETERAFGNPADHTGAQQIAEAQTVAKLDRQAREKKITDLEAERNQIPDNGLPQNEERRAQVEGQIKILRQESANKELETQIKIDELRRKVYPNNDALVRAAVLLADAAQQWKTLNLGNVALDFAQAAVRIPQALGQSLANGVFEAPKRGESKGTEIGHDVVEGLKGIGKQLFSELLTQGIEQLIGALVGQGAIAALLNATQSANTVALGANTVALAANTAAQGISGGASAAGGIASGVGGAAGGVASVASSAASSATLVGPLISAAGGIIGGVISGVMSLIGAHQIVKAINATTAAVLSLKGTGIGVVAVAGTSANALATQSQQAQKPSPGFLSGLLSTIATTASPIPINIASVSSASGLFRTFNPISQTTFSASPVSQSVTASGSGSGIPVIGGLLQSVFGFGGGASSKPVPVDVVSINPLSPISGLFKMFGFAEGGQPPVGVPSIVGEKGFELFIPREAGTIIPHEASRRILGGNSSLTSIATGNSHLSDSLHTYSATSNAQGSSFAAHSATTNNDNPHRSFASYLSTENASHVSGFAQTNTHGGASYNASNVSSTGDAAHSFSANSATADNSHTSFSQFSTAVSAHHHSLRGFAEGGEPPVGIHSIVGEEGFELFVPHQTGLRAVSNANSVVSHAYRDSNTNSYAGASYYAGDSASASSANINHFAGPQNNSRNSSYASSGDTVHRLSASSYRAGDTASVATIHQANNAVYGSNHYATPVIRNSAFINHIPSAPFPVPAGGDGAYAAPYAASETSPVSIQTAQASIPSYDFRPNIAAQIGHNPYPNIQVPESGNPVSHSNITVGDVHVNNPRNADEVTEAVLRRLPDKLKTRYSGFTAYSR